MPSSDHRDTKIDRPIDGSVNLAVEENEQAGDGDSKPISNGGRWPFHKGDSDRSVGRQSQSAEDVSVDGHFPRYLQMPKLMEDLRTLGPIEFYAIIPGDESHLVKIAEMPKSLVIDWRNCRVASEDLRVSQRFGNCRECFAERPLAILMPCGHGGSCLRCSISKKGKEKVCFHCHQVKFFNQVVEFIMKIGESVEEVEVESEDREFSIFPVLNIIRMVRSSLRVERKSSLSQQTDFNQQNNTHTYDAQVETSRSGDIRRLPNIILSPKSSNEETKSSKPSKYLSLEALSSHHDDRNLNLKAPITSTTDSAEESKRRSSQNSETSLEKNMKMLPALVKKPLLYRGSINERKSKLIEQVNFEINERDSEHSISQDSQKIVVSQHFFQDSSKDSDLSASSHSVSSKQNADNISNQGTDMKKVADPVKLH